MGSAQSARRIQPGGRVGRAGQGGSHLHARGPPPARARLPPGAFPPLAVRRDRLRVGWEGRGEGGSRLRPRVLQPPGSSRRFPQGPRKGLPPRLLPGARDSGRRACRGAGSPCSRRGCRLGRTVLSAPRPRPAAEPVRVTFQSRRQGSAAMSVTHPSRLETRTKKSNTCASQGARRNPTAQ